MMSQLDNELVCIKYCWGVYKNSIVNTVREDYWTAGCAIIASNVKQYNLLNETVSLGEYRD